MIKYTHNPYEMPTPTTPRDEASSSNQQLVNTQKTPDRPANMRRVNTRTRVNLNEKLLSEAQEAAFVANQEFLKKQEIKRNADLNLVQIAEEEERALIIAEAMQQAVQIEKLTEASKKAALTLMMQNHMKNNAITRKQALQQLQNHHDKQVGVNLTLKISQEAISDLQNHYTSNNNIAASSITNKFATVSPRSGFLSEEHLQQSITPSRSVFLSAEYLQQPTLPNYWTKKFMRDHATISKKTLRMLQNDYLNSSKASSNFSSNNI